MLRASSSRPPEEGDSEPAGPAATSTLDDLARLALRGGPADLREFLQAIAPLVRRICRGVMGRDNPDLEDAIQDSLIDVARALRQFRFEASISHYVTRMAIRRAISSRRRTRLRWKQQASLATKEPTGLAYEGPAVGRIHWARKMLDDLNEDQATALLLRVMLGHSIEEIASITGVSVNTVKTRLRLGKNQLRRRLEKTGR